MNDQLPKFIDLFIKEIRKKKKEFNHILERGPIDALLKDFNKLFSEHWHPLQKEFIEDAHIFAIDGSVGSREYWNGARLLVSRALAISNRRERLRNLEVRIFRSRGSEEDIHWYISHKSELLEVWLAFEALDRMKGSKNVLLIDGSLYGRLVHPPEETPVEGDRTLLIDLAEAFCKLLSECRRRNVIIVGVSKDSRVENFRDLLLKRMISDELKRLEPYMETEDLNLLKKSIHFIKDRPNYSLSLLRKLKSKHGNLLGHIGNMLMENARSLPDSQLIRYFAEAPGYSTPILLGLPEWARREITALEKYPKKYMSSKFRYALLETDMSEEEFIERAVNVYNRVFESSTIVTYHLLFDIHDIPLRIDVPSWVLGIDKRMKDNLESVFIENPGVVGTINSILRAGYAGLRNYNILLKRVDEEVRLTNKDLDSIYERVLEKELGTILTHTRRYRRVRIP